MCLAACVCVRASMCVIAYIYKTRQEHTHVKANNPCTSAHAREHGRSLRKVKTAAQHRRETSGQRPTRQGDGGLGNGLLPLTLLSGLCRCVCVLGARAYASACRPTLCLCVCSDRPRQQTPRHPLDHSRAGRQSAARQSDWREERQSELSE